MSSAFNSILILVVGIFSCTLASTDDTIKAFIHSRTESCSLEKIEVITNEKVYHLYLWETKRAILAPNIPVILDNEPQHNLNIKGHCSYQMISQADNSEFNVEIITFNNVIRGSITKGRKVFDIVSQAFTAGRSELSLKPHAVTYRGVCGTTNSRKNHSESHSLHDNNYQALLRRKRSASVHIVYPNQKNYFIELFLVLDNNAFKALSSAESAQNYAIEVVNHVNAYYRQFSVHVVLVGLEIWTSEQKIEVTTDSDTSLDKFSLYRRENIKTKHDNAQMITSVVFANGFIGKAYMNGMCEYGLSAGITTMHGATSALDTAATLAHEMGHNFGLEHDDGKCSCSPDTYCMMSASAGEVSVLKWSDCSTTVLQQKLQTGLSYCLMDDPTVTKMSSDFPTCGNGIVDAGEECDLGVRATSTKCCNSATCKFQAGAKCASGSCCNTELCTLKPKGTLCSYNDTSSDGECDFPEYCDGKTEFCPQDTYPAEGEKQCGGNQGDYCYKKRCGSRTAMCKKIFAFDAEEAEDICFKENMQTTSEQVLKGFCSYTVTSQTANSRNYDYKACSSSNYRCGSTHCHSTTNQEYTIDDINWPGQQTIFLLTENQYVCYHARIDLTLTGLRDPSLAPNGATCGSNMVCSNSKCVPLANIRTAQCQSVTCQNGGICNNFGGCHCPAGYSGPTCAQTCSTCCGGSEQANYCERNPSNDLLVIIICSVVAAIVVIIIVVVVSVVLVKKGVCAKKSASSERGSKVDSTRSPKRDAPISTISGNQNSHFQGYGNKAFTSSNPNLYPMSAAPPPSAPPASAMQHSSRPPTYSPTHHSPYVNYSGPQSPPYSQGSRNYAYQVDI